MSDMIYDQNNKQWKTSRQIELENLKNDVINNIINMLTSGYALQFTFTLPTGQKITVVASWVKQT